MHLDYLQIIFCILKYGVYNINWYWWLCWWFQKAGPAFRGIKREWTESDNWKRRSDYRRRTKNPTNHTPL